MSDLDFAPCGCVSHQECAICFEMICSAGSSVRDICYDCIDRNMITDRDDSGRIIHPVQRTPLRMCRCGKVWNGDCARDTLFAGNTYVIDPQRLAACQTPQDRMNLLMDPSARIRSSEIHGLVNT